ncbi:MAG TPA: trypsin-like peptidase domain-containing protein [bacterium]|nr:trypsin-like peptidase domain-containing protein [bacterium]
MSLRLKIPVIVGLAVLWNALPVSAQKGDPRDALALAELSAAMQAIAARVQPAVVQIVSSGYVPAGEGAESAAELLRLQRSGGSGVIVDPTGYIVTNAHVVANAQRVQVVLTAPPGRNAFQSIVKPRGPILPADVVGLDEETDLAVLKVDTSGLPYLPLGNSDDVKSGQVVLAFGAPLGLDNSVTMGVVSAVARQLRPEDRMIYIQTDASINPGNSGGPLVNTAGQVVGINTSIITRSGGSEGLGFAAPSNIVRTVYEQIRAAGRVRRGGIGVLAQTINPVLAEGLGLARDWGVVAGDVSPDSPAARAGVRRGDIILALNGKPMENARQFDVNLYQFATGDKVRLDLQRGDEQLSLEVQVIERPGASSELALMVSPEENLIGPLGILALDLNDEVAAMLPPLRFRTGVVVAARASDATPGEDNFRPGDVIYAVNRVPVESIRDLRAALDQLQSGDAVVAEVERGGALRYVALRME